MVFDYICASRVCGSIGFSISDICWWFNIVGKLNNKLRNMDGGIGHWCPGCDSLHMIYTTKKNINGCQWNFNGNLDSPTFSPSINIRAEDKDPEWEFLHICHYFIQDGKLKYCGDSTHKYSGQEIDLPDLPDWNIV